MSNILDLPDDLLIEIMLKMEHIYDYFAMLTTCQRLFGLKKRLAFIQESTNHEIRFTNLYEGTYSREILTAIGTEAISVTFVNDVIADTNFLEHKCRFNGFNLHKIENLCKLAGNIVHFTKSIEKEAAWKEINPGNYLELTYCWINDKLISAKIYIKNVEQLFYHIAEDHRYRTNVDLSEYHQLYDKYYKGTKLEEFPGKLLLSALEKNPIAQKLENGANN